MDQLTLFIQQYYLYILIWEIIWKGIALWKSARRNEYAWFIILLIINTIGILPIIYILYDKYLRTYFNSLWTKLTTKK